MCNGNKPVNSTVTLTVDTVNITEATKNANVTFSDDQGDPAEIPGQPGQYESTVNRNAQIIWTGRAANGTDTVCITDVSKKAVGGGSDILVAPIGRPVSCQVTGRVVNAQIAGDEFYTISFNVIRAGVTTGYSIDPKIRMNT